MVASMLKTPLQRLAMKVEASPISEADKKYLLSKSQEANELFKETLKKFGILVVPEILGSLLGSKKETFYYYTCFLYPLVYASSHI